FAAAKYDVYNYKLVLGRSGPKFLLPGTPSHGEPKTFLDLPLKFVQLLQCFQQGLSKTNFQSLDRLENSLYLRLGASLLHASSFSLCKTAHHTLKDRLKIL